MVHPPSPVRRVQRQNGKVGNHQKEDAMNVHSTAATMSHTEASSSVVHRPDLIENFETPRRVRMFDQVDQVDQSEDEFAIISEEQFSAATDQRRRTPKRTKTFHGNTSNVVLQNQKTRNPSPGDNIGVPWQDHDPNASYDASVTVEGTNATPSFHYSSSSLTNTKHAEFSSQTLQPGLHHSSEAKLSPANPGDIPAFNAYIPKLGARRANNAKWSGNIITDGSALAGLDHLPSSVPQKTVTGQWNCEKAKSDQGHTHESVTNTTANDTYKFDPTSEYHSSYGLATSVTSAAQHEQAASPAESRSALGVIPQAYPFASPEKASRSTTSKAHPSPTVIVTKGESASLGSFRNPDELCVSIENADTSCSSTSGKSALPEILRDNVSHQERSITPSPPALDHSEKSSILFSGSSSSELSDHPSHAGSDPFKEASVQVDAAQSNPSIGGQVSTPGVGDQDKYYALASMNSMYVGASNRSKAYEIAEKDPYHKLVEMLFDGVPKEVYEALNDQSILRTSLSDVARWTRPRDDSIQSCAIERDPSGAELIRVVAEVEQLLITMWAAVESMAVLLYAELKDGFTIGMLQEHTRQWQTEIYRTYELLLTHLTTIARWKQSYFAISNAKKRSARRGHANPYSQLFEKTTVTDHLAYGSAAYLHKLSWAISSAKCAYDVACMKGPRRVGLVGQHRRKLGKEYDLCLRGLRKFNQFIMKRDWNVKELVKIIAAPSTPLQQGATPETPSCGNPVVVGASAPQENHVSKMNEIADSRAIDAVIAEGRRATSHAAKKDEGHVKGYFVQPARQRIFATSLSPEPQADVEPQDEISQPIAENEMEYGANEVHHKVAVEWTSRGHTLQRPSSVEAEKATSEVDVSSSVIGGSANGYFETP